MANLYPHWLVLQVTLLANATGTDVEKLPDDFTPVAIGYHATSPAVDIQLGDKLPWSDELQPITAALGDGSRLVPIPDSALRTYPRDWFFKLTATDRSGAPNDVTVTLYGLKERTGK